MDTASRLSPASLNQARLNPARLNPIDPAQHRAHIAAIYATLPAALQSDALNLVAQWPRLIHALAREGQLSAPLGGESVQP
ncbi:MAG: hypothetical protein JNJ73_03320 [Hyphomonadaceae bacterium]|nr:hypothetical protein [Hyphomonadaceae bacterium]